MNIVFLIGEMRGGGAEGVVATLTSELAERGHRITLISHLEEQAYTVSEKVNLVDVRDWQYNTFQGSYPIRLYKKAANRFRDLFNIKRIIHQEKPDVVISFLVNWLWQTILICKWRIPIVCAERNAMEYPHSGKNFWNKQILYRFADLVQVMSRYDKAWLRKRYKRIVAMPNPLRFSPMTRNEYDDTFNERKNILACGRLDPQKGFDKMIKAFAMISDAFPEWDIDICGADMAYSHYSETIKDIIKENNLENRIHFIGFHKDVDNVMRTHSVFCLSSKHEGFPNVLSEAMSCGLACVSFDIVTGPAEIINDGLDGVIVEDQNIDDLAKGLSKVLGDRDLRYSLGLHAIENIKRYNKDTVVDKWEKMFEYIIKDYHHGKN